ncbi:hypothetical protein SESBI_47500 [Sesbania bispinosa]|nr:hypothetical protein SESBI_47500 [Sesbania bispinosa]
MKRQGKRTKGLEDMFDVCATEERDRKKIFKSNRSSGKASTFNEAPPIPLGRLQVCQLVEEWLKDGTLRIKVSKAPLTKEQYDNPEYCVLHKTNSHTTMDCWTVRRAFHKQVEEAYDEERALSVGLAKTRGFRMLFGQLGMEGDAQREASEAIIHIARKWGGHFGAVNAPLTRGKEIEIPGVKAPFEATESHLIDASLFDEVAPPGSSQLKTEQGILLKDIECYNEPGYVHHPVQAFKIPKAKNVVGIEKEYLPNGERNKAILSAPKKRELQEMKKKEKSKKRRNNSRTSQRNKKTSWKK